MNRITIIALRVIIIASLLGSLVVQTVIFPLLWVDLADAPAVPRAALATIAVLWVLCLQVAAVCVWRLLTRVRVGSVFAVAAFRDVDVIAVAAAAASVLTFAVAVLLAPGATAPGVVGLVCGAALVIAGVALLVVVLRAVLAQAVAAKTELDAVI